jgi:hypothetical protein
VPDRFFYVPQKHDPDKGFLPVRVFSFFVGKSNAQTIPAWLDDYSYIELFVIPVRFQTPVQDNAEQ